MRGIGWESTIFIYPKTMPVIASLECSRCQNQISADKYETVCPKCAGALYVRYDAETLKKTAKRPEPGGAQSMWRYQDVLPAVDPITLGEIGRAHV